MGWSARRRRQRWSRWFWRGADKESSPALMLPIAAVAGLLIWAKNTSTPWVRVTIYIAMCTPVALVVVLFLMWFVDGCLVRWGFYSARLGRRLDRRFDRHVREHPFRDTTGPRAGHKRFEKHRR